MANDAMADTLVRLALQWVTAAPANKMAKSHANKNLGAAANATFAAFKEGMVDDWDKDYDDIEDDDNKDLIAMLKAIEENDAMKEDLHIAVAKRMAATNESERAADDNDDQSGTTTPSGGRGGRRGRGRGTSRGRGRGRASVSTSVVATGDDDDVGEAEAVASARDPETGRASRKRARVEDEDDDGDQ